jgi:putative ABC transport system permease protein
MTKLQFLTNRHWRRRPIRALLTVLSVAIAVAAMLSTSMAQSMVRNAYRTMTATVNGAPTIDILSQEASRFPLADLPPLSDVPDVRAQGPLLFRTTMLRSQSARSRVLTVGTDLTRLQQAVDLEPSSGQLPADPNEVLLGAPFAESAGIAVGDRIMLFGRRGPKNFAVSGLLSAETMKEFSDGAAVVMPLDRAQDVFELPGLVDRMRVFLSNEDARASTTKALQQQLGERFLVRSTLRAGGIAEETLRSTELALQFSTALSLMMSICIVINTLRMNFHERHREFAILRAIGASQKQLDGILASEGLAMGILGGVLGIPAGIFLADGLRHVLERILRFQGEFVWPHWSTMVMAFLVGEVAVVAALIWTKWGGNKVSPAEAMREVESSTAESPPWLMFVAAIGAWFIALGGLALVRAERIDARWTIPFGLLMLASYVATLPVLLPWVLAGCRALLWRFWLYRLLTSGQLERRPVRVGLTAGVLVVAISSGLGLGSAISTQIQDIRDWYRRTMSGDYFLFAVPTQESTGSDTDQAREQIQGVPGIALAEAVRFVGSRVGNESAICVVRDFHESLPLPWRLSAEDERLLRTALSEGDVVVSSVLANRCGLKTGDTLVMEVQARAHPLRIAGIVSDYNFGGLSLFLSAQAAEKRLDLASPDLWIVKRASEAETPAPTDELRQVAQSLGLSLQSLDDMRGRLDQILNGVIGALWTLIMLGFVVSGFGVANTMTMHVLEQTREIGLLRVVGMTKVQVRWTILLQALLLGAAGVILGTAAGITTAAVIHWCSAPLMGRTLPFQVKFDLLVANALGGLVITLLAALVPAWRASKLPLAQAITYE